jgi:hypothetical protein
VPNFESSKAVSIIRIKKMGPRWWRYVLICNQPKRYLDDR